MSAAGAATTVPVLSDAAYINGKLGSIAQLQDLDTDLWTFKRFRKLNLYNLLQLQHRLTGLEAELCQRLASGLDIGGLMPDIQQTLHEYNTACTALSSLGRAAKPSANALAFLGEYSNSHLRELRDELELDKRDSSSTRLMSLIESEKTWIHQFIDRHMCLRRLFSADSTSTTPTPLAMLYPESHVRKTERILLTLSFCALLLGPIILLSYTRDKGRKLAIVAAFVTSAALLTAGLTKARNWEVLAVTAGYCAILVVFLSGNLGQ